MKKKINYNRNTRNFTYSIEIEGEFMGGGSAKTRIEAEEKVHKLAQKISSRVNSDDTMTYHRNPTKYELKFGYGAIHYREFPISEVVKPDGRIKKWFVSPDDGLRYYR